MDSTIKLSILIFLLPLASFTILAFLHKRLPRHGDWVGLGALGTALLCSLSIFGSAVFGSDPLFAHWTFDWIPTTAHKALKGGILVDGLTAVMLVVVTLVSFLVHLFSTKYMHGDVRYGRYYASLSLFTTSMLGIVFADNILYLFVFWELVGLSSYLLIGHWYEKKSASDAAIKAFITTRVGDVGMLLGMLIIYWKVGSLQYVDVFAACGLDGPMAGEVDIPMMTANWSWQTLAALGLFFGAMGKSAQFPLHVWLPDAMEGPTPVSALIHAATMVAAGVYLVGRLFPIFTSDAFIVVAYVGGITALFAATIAVVQDDIKKVLAYSTLSQLGYMVMALGVGGFVLLGYYSGLFHLTTHAFFKAGLFLGSGSVIHAMHHEQSLSKYGGLKNKLPITHATYFICVLAIAGVPLFSGFFSKDQILGSTLQFVMDHPKHWFLVVSGFFTAFLTAFYMFRQYFLTFHGKPRDHHAYDHAHESPLAMTIPLMVLGGLALCAGWFGGTFERIMPSPHRDEIVLQYAKYHEAADRVAGNEATVALVASLRAGDAHAAEGSADAHAEEHAKDDHAAAHGHDEHHAHHGVGSTAHYGAMILSILVAFSGILLAVFTYVPKPSGLTRINPALIARNFEPIYILLKRKYYFDELYGFVFLGGSHALVKLMSLFDRVVVDGIVNAVGFVGQASAYLITWFDKFIVDGAVHGSGVGTNELGGWLALTQTGKVRHYLLSIAVGVVILTIILTLVV